MKFFQQYKLYSNAHKELKNSNADIRCCTLCIGNRYTLKTANYDIRVMKFIHDVYRIRIKDKHTNNVAQITGKIAESVYFKMYKKFWSAHTNQR